MKFRKILITYKAIYDAFINFGELKCNLSDSYETEYIHVRKDLCPDNVTSAHCNQVDSHIFFNLSIDTDFGEYLVPVNICLHCGTVAVEFDSVVNQKGGDEVRDTEVELNEKQFNKVIYFCFPLVEKFLENLLKIERNHPCTDGCTFYNYKIKNGECGKMFVSKKDIASKKGKK